MKLANNTLRSGFFLSIAAIAAFLIGRFILEGNKKSPSQMDEKTVESENIELGKRLVSDELGKRLVSNDLDKRQGDEETSFTKDQDLRMSAATAAVKEICNKIEKENSDTFFIRRLPGRDITCISITPPTSEQIGQISKIMTLHMRGISKHGELYRELQNRLMAIYNEHLMFKKAFRVLHLEQAEDGSDVKLTEADYDSLNVAVPSESGTITMQGRVRLYDFKMNAWKTRYGHIVQLNSPSD